MSLLLLFRNHGTAGSPVGPTDPYIPAGGRFAGNTGGPVVKIGAQDWTLDPGPFRVTGVQLSGSVPGGYGSGSFDVPVANAYLAPHHSLREGAWVEVYDDAHELYEGQILSVKPSVDASGNHKLSVVCGGIITVASMRGDVSQTWIHRGNEGWMLRPIVGREDFGDLLLEAGCVELRVKQASLATAGGTYVDAFFHLDGGLSDGSISRVYCVGSWNVLTNAANTWQWALYAGPSLADPTYETLATYSNDLSYNVPLTLTPSAGMKCLLLRLQNTYRSAESTAPSYVRFPVMEIYSSGRTTKPRIDEAMVSLATRTGLALTSDSEPIGPPLEDLHIGGSGAATNAAGGLDTFGKLHAQPFEWAFWDKRHFVCRSIPILPSNDAHVIVVGGGFPGLELWDVAEYDEDVPDFACVEFGNFDDANLPEGYVRHIYRPTTPPDDAGLKIQIVPFSTIIMTDKSAMALGDNIVGRTPGTIPSGAILDVHPQRAKLGHLPGNNIDPTGSYQDISEASAVGTLSGFAYTAASGWAGTNSPADPTLLVGDGVDDYVSFGDLAQCDFGTAAFSVRVWFTLSVAKHAAVLIAKIGGTTAYRGWGLYVNGAGQLEGYVGEDVATTKFRCQSGSTVLAADVPYCAHLVYAGSGADITLYLDGVAETLTATGAVGAWNSSNAEDLQLFKAPA